MSLKFDQLLKDGEIIKAAYLFAEEGYQNGDFGHTRKLLIEFLAKRVQELEDIIYQDARQAVLERLYEENERYREALKGVIDIIENEDWSKYEATALQDSIHDFITIKNSDLLEETE